MMEKLDGYKTYIVMAVVIACVVVEKGLGWDIPGFDAGDDWMGWILGALGLGAMRSAVAKV